MIAKAQGKFVERPKYDKKQRKAEVKGETTLTPRGPLRACPLSGRVAEHAVRCARSRQLGCLERANSPDSSIPFSSLLTAELAKKRKLAESTRAPSHRAAPAAQAVAGAPQIAPAPGPSWAPTIAPAAGPAMPAPYGMPQRPMGMPPIGMPPMGMPGMGMPPPGMEPQVLPHKVLFVQVWRRRWKRRGSAACLRLFPERRAPGPLLRTRRKRFALHPRPRSV